MRHAGRWAAAAVSSWRDARAPPGAMSVPATPERPLDIARHFAALPDPRHRAFRDHHLLGDILVIALCAVLSGCDSWDDVAELGCTKEPWLRSLGLRLPHGIPS